MNILSILIMFLLFFELLSVSHILLGRYAKFSLLSSVVLSYL